MWTALINDVINNKADATPYVYVLVNKVVPQNLTLWNNGVAQYVGIPVNTGAPGADTTDGTYAVFEHVRYSDMKGTNTDGSTYNDPNVPYASYFNGGDALHGFIRASYGTPQSNGCVEMSYADAALVWPLTPIGTLVTVEGPNFGTAPPPHDHDDHRSGADDHHGSGTAGDDDGTPGRGHHDRAAALARRRRGDGGRAGRGAVCAAEGAQPLGAGGPVFVEVDVLVRRGRGRRSGPRPRRRSATS